MFKKSFMIISPAALCALVLSGCISVSNVGNGNIVPMSNDNPISQITSTAEKLAAQPSGTYEVEPTHTTVVWRLTHMGASNYTARFDKISGTLNFDSKNPTASSVNISIDPNSVSTGLPNFDKEIATKFFDVGNHPKISFVSTGLVKTGDTTGDLTGNLTFRGVTKPVTLKVQFNGGLLHPFAGRHLIGFSARGNIKRSDFGLTAMTPMIGDNVELIIETEFLKK